MCGKLALLSWLCRDPKYRVGSVMTLLYKWSDIMSKIRLVNFCSDSEPPGGIVSVNHGTRKNLKSSKTYCFKQVSVSAIKEIVAFLAVTSAICLKTNKETSTYTDCEHWGSWIGYLAIKSWMLPYYLLRMDNMCELPFCCNIGTWNRIWYECWLRHERVELRSLSLVH